MELLGIEKGKITLDLFAEEPRTKVKVVVWKVWAVAEEGRRVDAILFRPERLFE
jgi:hypothetical protein